MPAGFYFTVTVFLGLVLGSFATALSWRLPRGLPLAMERSECPSCKRKLDVLDLVPVFSWLLLRGRCRTCKARIGLRYPAIELVTLLLCLVFYWRFGFSAAILPLFALAPVIVAMADIDIGFKILPDSLNLAVLLLGIAAVMANAFAASDPFVFMGDQMAVAGGGLLLYGAGSAALRWGVTKALKREALGLGDVKFFAAGGFWLGDRLEVLAHFMMISGFAGVVLALAWKTMRGEAQFPFGPALLAAFVAVLLWEPPTFIFF